MTDQVIEQHIPTFPRNVIVIGLPFVLSWEQMNCIILEHYPLEALTLVLKEFVSGASAEHLHCCSSFHAHCTILHMGALFELTSHLLHRSTILQQQFNRTGKAEHGSVALPAVMRSGSSGPETFNVGSMPSPQQQVMVGQMHRGHMPPLVRLLLIFLLTSGPSEMVTTSMWEPYASHVSHRSSTVHSCNSMTNYFFLVSVTRKWGTLYLVMFFSL